MIKYLGSKRALLPWILEVVRALEVRSAADPFSGSARVAHGLKSLGLFVIAGDELTFAATLARGLIEADRLEYPPERVTPILEALNKLPPRPGWFTRRYAEEARYIQPANAARIEAIREAIEVYPEPLRSLLLTSLLLAADRVDSTVGLQMAYLKRWAPRSYRLLELTYPPLLPGEGRALQAEASSWIGAAEVDLVYLDPPYNQHSYLGNYHLWETLVRFDDPPTYGIARKRLEVKEHKSPFNQRRLAWGALERLLAAVKAPHLLLSFSDEGFWRRDELEALLAHKGWVVVLEHPHRRYIGTQIGIHNPQGVPVGTPGAKYNREFLFYVGQERASLERVLRFKEASYLHRG